MYMIHLQNHCHLPLNVIAGLNSKYSSASLSFNVHLPPRPTGEGPGGQDLHQVADAPSEDPASPCTVVTHSYLNFFFFFFLSPLLEDKSSYHLSWLSSSVLQLKSKDFIIQIYTSPPAG